MMEESWERQEVRRLNDQSIALALECARLRRENERLRERVTQLETERADLLTDEQAYWLYGMNPW